ncbi:MAG: LamG-like jellyroll fold domain-containing protein, partial [bacterium]
MNNFNIWNRAITASEVAAAKVNQLAGNESGLVASYTLSGYHYGVATSTWTFANGAGITSNSGGFTNSIQNAPQGTQAAFLQNQGCITTSAVTMTPGKKYAITFALAERSTDTVKNPVEVIMDGQSLGVFTPTGSSYVSYTTSAFTAAAGNHTLTFRGTINTGDSTAFVDNISINEQINQPTLTNTLSNPTPYINAVSLDGTNNGRIQLPSYGFNDFTQGLSTGLRVYPISTSGWKSLFEFGNSGTDRINLCQSGDQLGFEVWRGSTSSYVYSNSGVVELNKWQYFSVVQKPDGSTTLYKNGNVVATGTASIANNLNRTTNY